MNGIRKYKYWHCEDKKMYNVLSLTRVFEDESFNRVFIDKPLKEGEPMNYRCDGEMGSLLEFTGFLDSEGNEIYEGYILSDSIEDNGEIIESKETVYYDESLGAWMLDQSDKQDRTYGASLFENITDYEYKIIGNVFENPELLCQ